MTVKTLIRAVLVIIVVTNFSHVSLAANPFIKSIDTMAEVVKPDDDSLSQNGQQLQSQLAQQLSKSRNPVKTVLLFIESLEYARGPRAISSQDLKQLLPIALSQVALDNESVKEFKKLIEASPQVLDIISRKAKYFKNDRQAFVNYQAIIQSLGVAAKCEGRVNPSLVTQQSELQPSENASKMITTAIENNQNPMDLVRSARANGRSKTANELLDTLEYMLRTLPVGPKDIAPLKGVAGVNVRHGAVFKVKLPNGLVAVFKIRSPRKPEQPIPEREVTAYRISRLLNLDIVPVTTMRQIGDLTGSIQLFLSNGRTLERVEDQPEKGLFLNGNPYDIEATPSGQKLLVFDWLLNNHDRGSNSGNYFISDLDGYVYGIDHGVTFVAHDKPYNEEKLKVPYIKAKFLTPELRKLFLSASESELQSALSIINPKRAQEFLLRYRALRSYFDNPPAKKVEGVKDLAAN